MLILSFTYYQNWYEVIFPIILAIFLLIGEIRIRIYKVLAENPTLRPYFD